MERSKTYIKELDEALLGGLPKNNTVLVSGSPGTGKTVLGLQWLMNGIKHEKEKGMYITVTESEAKLMKNMEAFNFFDRKQMDEGNLFIYDLRHIKSGKGKKKKRIVENPMDVVNFIQEQIKKTEVNRLVIDSITALCEYVESKDRRNFFWKLAESLNFMDCTLMFISEKLSAERYSSPSANLEEFTSDGILSLEQIERNNVLVRTLKVIKMRGTEHSADKFKIEITKKGLSLMPLISFDK